MARGEKKTELIAVRLDPDMKAAVVEHADNEDRPLGMMARILIKEALEARELKLKVRIQKKRN